MEHVSSILARWQWNVLAGRKPPDPDGYCVRCGGHREGEYEIKDKHGNTVNTMPRYAGGYLMGHHQQRSVVDGELVWNTSSYRCSCKAGEQRKMCEPPVPAFDDAFPDSRGATQWELDRARFVAEYGEEWVARKELEAEIMVGKARAAVLAVTGPPRGVEDANEVPF
jgi:hypothetical protein